MINYLLLLQFPLLYCITVMLGLVVYGSDFESYINWLYFLPLLVMPTLWGMLQKNTSWLTGKITSQLILWGLLLTALLASRNLHFSWWDEHSAGQAVLISGLGLFSCLASLIAAARLTHWQGDHQVSMSGALLVLGLSWLPVFYYPMASFLMISFIAILSVIWSASVSVSTLSGYGKPALAIRYLLFLLMMDVSLVIWDYQTDTSWSLHLMVVLVAAASGCRVFLRAGERTVAVLSVVALGNFLATIFWPSFIIHFAHSVIAGIAIGAVIGLLLCSDNKHRPARVISIAVSVVAGLAVGYLFYANLAFAVWRWVFLLPLPVMLFLLLRHSASETSSFKNAQQ